MIEWKFHLFFRSQPILSQEVIQLMERGESERHIGATNMNEQSSRSHTIFRMVIESKERNGECSRVRKVLCVASCERSD